MAQIDKPNLHFNTVLYTGNGSTQSITGVGFQPDFLWIKERGDASSHAVMDAVRGNTKKVMPNDSSAESTESTYITSFDSDGFSIGQNNGINQSGINTVAWNWKANGAGSANTDGDINSTVSVNTTAGFSIVSYTGNLSSSTSATVGHGLGVAPQMIITKRLSNSSEWGVLHENLSSWNYVLWMNTTDDQQDKSGNGSMSAPTSTVFSTNYTNALNVNSSTYIAYCFAEKKGFSNFGYLASTNSADNAFVYTGFAPAFVMLKKYNGTGTQWVMYDNKRPGYNQTSNALFANASSAEATDLGVDLLSNGFKLRSTNNQNVGEFIYMAFAENPIVGSNNTPATAR